MGYGLSTHWRMTRLSFGGFRAMNDLLAEWNITSSVVGFVAGAISTAIYNFVVRKGHYSLTQKVKHKHAFLKILETDPCLLLLEMQRTCMIAIAYFCSLIVVLYVFHSFINVYWAVSVGIAVLFLIASVYL